MSLTLLKYHKVLSQSRDIATKIAQYGESFDNIIISFCADKTKTVEDRKQKIHTFIDKSKIFEDQAKDMQTALNSLKTEFGNFVSTFATWAVDKEKEITEKIKAIEEELKDLERRLGEYQIALAALGAVSAAIIPATSLLFAFGKESPAAPFIVAGGLILAGISIASTITLVILIGNLKSDIDNKTREKKDLEEQRDRIRTARTELVQIGNTKLLQFQQCIGVLSNYWKDSVRDATLISQWLEHGADDADCNSEGNLALSSPSRGFSAWLTNVADTQNDDSPRSSSMVLQTSSAKMDSVTSILTYRLALDGDLELLYLEVQWRSYSELRERAPDLLNEYIHRASLSESPRARKRRAVSEAPLMPQKLKRARQM
ncbi:hypothetical protein BDV23DRAFT_189366 [Aspergillus alliaceus]|uniref:Uncharacterized protein n=1 Tax=Petromyces alliaceus TaxID=209559 RepID=A0A5N7BRP3_PETAA|nr:hypothetical protein BDV23DRAFT_189366 [Aspergillus alliaceus]